MINEKLQAFVREVATALVEQSTQEGIREVRCRFTGDRGHFNFAWVMVDPHFIQVEGSETGVPGFYAYTNERDDAMVPYFYQTATRDNAAELVEKIVTYVTSKLQPCETIELLMQCERQTGNSGSQQLPNLVGSSDAGFAAIHAQVELIAI